MQNKSETNRLLCLNWHTQLCKETYEFFFFPLPGDQVSRRGALTGGYYDTRRSRLDLQKSKLQLMETLRVQEQEYNEHRTKLEELEGQITQLVSRMQTIETKNSKHK